LLKTNDNVTAINSYLMGFLLVLFEAKRKVPKL